MDENKVYEENLEESSTIDVGDETAVSQPTDEPVTIIPANEDNTSDLVGKLVMGAATAAVGAGVAYVVKNRKSIKKSIAERKKAKAEKRLAKEAEKIKKANDVLQKLEEPKAIPEECEVTVTATE